MIVSAEVETGAPHSRMAIRREGIARWRGTVRLLSQKNVKGKM
jgi:hypothetical protein